MSIQQTTLEKAKLLHDIYERLAPEFGYETRDDTKEFDPTSANGQLMIATVAEFAESEVEPYKQALAKLVAEGKRHNETWGFLTSAELKAAEKLLKDDTIAG